MPLLNTSTGCVAAFKQGGGPRFLVTLRMAKGIRALVVGGAHAQQRLWRGGDQDQGDGDLQGHKKVHATTDLLHFGYSKEQNQG